MKKLLLGTLFLALASIAPNQAVAEVNISIGVSLPPLIRFQAPPDVIVIPDTDYVYAVPGIDVDMFFWNGWWWRLWEGRWYRSHYYDRGWGYYGNIPSFYFDVDPGWRTYYRDRNWYGHRWDYQRIPYRSLQQNWRTWNTNRYWERRGTWGVQNYQPRPRQQRQELRQQRQIQYQQRPEVQRFQQQRQQVQQPQRRQQPLQQRQPQVQQPQRKMQQQQQRQPQVQQPQRQKLQQQQGQPQVQQTPGQVKPQQQRQYKVQEPQRQNQPQQQEYQPQRQDNMDKSDHQQSQGKSEGRGSEGRR